MRRSALFWGALLIVFGILLLLYNMNIISISIWQIFWPVLLIAFGLWILFGTVLRRPGQEEQVIIPLNAAGRARIRIYHGAGRLSLTGKTEPGFLVKGSFAGGLDYHTRRDGDLINVDMRVHDRFFSWGWGAGNRFDWVFSLTDGIPLLLDLNTGASESQLDLSELHVADLSLNTGASSTLITLPSAAGMTRVRIESGAASVSMIVPDGVAARIRAHGELANIKIDQTRFPRQGDYYQSADYETAPNKVDLDVEVGVGVIDIR
jgi:hypothetical protein